MVVLPFSVDAGDVPRGCLQMTQTSIAQRRVSNWHKSDHMALITVMWCYKVVGHRGHWL